MTVTRGGHIAAVCFKLRSPPDLYFANHWASWAALCPGNNESAGKRKSGKTRHGTSCASFPCEAANAARRTKTVFRAKYDSLVIRRGHKKTIIALAHWIRALKKYGYWPTASAESTKAAAAS